MYDFTPIPGCWYRDENQRELLYVPAPPGGIVDETDEWYYRAGMSLEPGYPEGALVEVYNPHPPTRTEWATARKLPAGDMDRLNHHGTDEKQARRSADEVYSLFARQVTETEWQEVDQ